MSILFISDLHLSDERPQLTQAFLEFLHARATNCTALYILGDFFDAWIGDDDDSLLVTPVTEALSALHKRGVAIFLMHGNRDFLLGDSFAARAGATIIPEGTIVDLFGCPTLLLHGDSLCTRDTDYLAVRQQVRSPQWQAQVLAQPIAIRRAMAERVREQSQTMVSAKAEDIMDVTTEEVVKVMSEANVLRLIHGHTHRPARHPLVINAQAAERIVLGDWHDYGWCLEVTENSCELQNWKLAHPLEH